MFSRPITRSCARHARHVLATSARQYSASSRLRTPLSARSSLQTSYRPGVVRQQARCFSSKTTADEKVEEIQDLYATAQDEFEIAAEETEGNTVYAADDRVAAREALDKLKEMYEAVVEGPDREVGEEVKRRVGHRIRELDSAVVAMEEHASQGD